MRIFILVNGHIAPIVMLTIEIRASLHLTLAKTHHLYKKL